ncbi:MAG TPA: substrate-binding periplasmic protein [Desulfobacterales bacterium]
MDAKNTPRPSFVVLIILFAAALIAACGGTAAKSRETTTATAADALRVGVSPDFPPLIHKQRGTITGLEAELAREFAAFYGQPHRFVEIPWPDLIPALLDGRIDIIMSGMSITSQRSIRIAFSQPYFRTGQMAVVRREDKGRFPTGFYGIRGQAPVLRFGVVEGTTGEIFVRRNFGRANRITTYRTAREGLADLTTRVMVRRIDIFITDGPVQIMLLAEQSSKELGLLPYLLTEESLAWGMRKEDRDLQAAADGFLEMLKNEDRLEPIIQHWIPYADAMEKSFEN